MSSSSIGKESMRMSTNGRDNGRNNIDFLLINFSGNATNNRNHGNK